MCLRSKYYSMILLVLVAIILIISVYIFWFSQSNTEAIADKETLFQIAAFNTFSSGNYDGFLPYSELAEHGDFGIGTFHGLDGEMIALDGVFYQIPFDGKPKQATPSMKAPYATVTFFETDQSITLTKTTTYSEIKTIINNHLPDNNSIYAIKISGTYVQAETRSVPLQTKPYPKLEEAILDQSIFNLNNVSATAVGFWFPNSMDGVDYPGYHLHLITNDKTGGGHLLDFTVTNLIIEIDQTKKFNLVLP